MIEPLLDVNRYSGYLLSSVLADTSSDRIPSHTCDAVWSGKLPKHFAGAYCSKCRNATLAQACPRAVDKAEHGDGTILSYHCSLRNFSKGANQACDGVTSGNCMGCRQSTIKKQQIV